MTMRNVPSANAAREALRATGREAIEASRAVRQRLAELDAESHEVTLGYNAAQQAILDEQRDAQEEAAQLLAVLGEPAGGAAPAQPADATTVAPVPPAQPPTEPQPEPPATPVVPRQETHVFRVTHIHHSGMQLVFALAGVIIGLLVALFTYGPAFDGVHGSGHDALVTLWFIVLCGLGFCLGGWFGWFMEEHSANDDRDEDEDEPTA